MNLRSYIIMTIVETLLRALPFRAKTGLVRIGSPDKNSPVFLTCNFHLTVERVKRALKGMDAYLLVANSRGINVWCAATGGLFTSHDVVSVLKTSGIEDLVAHRNVILPQFAAAGIEATVVRKKTGWNIIWGPVYASDIPLFLKNGLEKTPQMREVRFPMSQRIEMAVAWAFPISAIPALIMIPFWPHAILPLVLLVWGLSLCIFVLFPLYGHLLNPGRKTVGFVLFDFGRGGLQLILWSALMVGFVAYSVSTGEFSWAFILRWGLVSFVVVLILSMDLMGSTPVYKSGLHEDSLLRVVLDKGKCKGAGFCEEVCPRNCYRMSADRRVATMPGAVRCVQCGACIVQCPFDALYFRSPKGEIIPPESIRRFKLNLLGKRLVETDSK